MLGKMECSILAGGMARKGKVDGVAGNIVERITEALAVDWVTRAGAGGRALDLAEHAEGGTMKRVLNVQMAGGQADLSAEALKDKLSAKLIEVFGEGATLEAVNLAEVTPVEPPVETPPPTAEPEPGPAVMEAAEVKAAVEATSLPAPAKAKLAEGKYADKAALDAAIQHEVAYLKAVTGSGAPFGLGPSLSPDAAKPMTDKEYDMAIGEVLERAGVPLAK